MSATCDPFTSKYPRVMAKRRFKMRKLRGDGAHEHRQRLITKWFSENDDMVCLFTASARDECNILFSQTRAKDGCEHANASTNATEATSNSDYYDNTFGAMFGSKYCSVATGVDVAPVTESVDSVLPSLESIANGDYENSNLCCATRTPPAKKSAGPKSRQGAKMVKNMERLQSTGHTLCPEEATMYRALSARANFLAQDRTDISLSGKELCREFAVPTKSSYARLKRVVRYLVGLPRLVYTFKFQDIREYADIYSDTDFAGCKETRRSTSGGVIMIGNHTIRHWSKTQTTIALSSGEAELSGIGSAIAEALGFQSLSRDLGWSDKIRVHSDATAAIGIARRRGLGKVRHLDVSDLWIQEKVRAKSVELVKILGADNPADILTKYVDRGILNKALTFMGLERREGRAKAAPKAMGVEQPPTL